MTQTQTEPGTDAAKATDTEIQRFDYKPNLAIGRQGDLKSLLVAMRGEIAKAVPRHIGPERMMKAALLAAIHTPKLLNCTQASFLEALMQAASLGLDCSGTIGSGYLVPYKNICTFIPGYRGLIDLARRSDQVFSIEAHVVYAQDDFTIQYGTDSKIVHMPYMGADRRDEITCVYAVAKLKGGAVQVEMMTLADVKRIQAMSAAGNKGPWKDHFSEMARKTVVRRIIKWLPVSAELEKAIEIDNGASGFDVSTVAVQAIDVTVSRTEDLANRLEANGEGETEAPVGAVDAATGEELPLTDGT